MAVFGDSCYGITTNYGIGPIHREPIFDTPLKRIQDDIELDRFDQLLFRIERLERDFRRFIAR